MVDNRPPLHVPLDLRRRRALDATSMIMQIVGSYVGYDQQRRCADKVYKHLYDIGVELITDEVRAVWGCHLAGRKVQHSRSFMPLRPNDLRL